MPGGLGARLNYKGALERALRKVFPDHYSYLLGEVALFSFLALLFTGLFLGLYYEPGIQPTLYDGSFEPARGLSLPRAFATTLAISEDVRLGDLIRRAHHFAAHLFIGSILLHACRTFLSGAFRRPREPNWLLRARSRGMSGVLDSRLMSLPSAAYRIETDRLVLRCFRPEDAVLLKAAVDASLDHLRPFLPWASLEPQSVEEKVGWLRRIRASFDLDQDYHYGVFDREESELVGGGGLHPRVGEGGLEIGYWIRQERARRGYGTEVAGALTRVGIELYELRRVEIHCAKSNAASSAVPRKLGFTLETTLRERTEIGDGRIDDLEYWTLFASDLPKSAAAKIAIHAFDAGGRRLI